MRCRDNKNHVILHERFYAEVFPPFRPFNERQLNLAREQGFEYLIGIPAARRNFHLWIGPSKSRHEGGQQVLANGLRGSQGEFARMFSKCLRHCGKGFVGECLHLLCERQQRFAARRERDMPSSAIEQRHAELIFKRLDLLRDCGLREQ